MLECNGEDGAFNRFAVFARVAAWKLRRQLLKAGLSQYEPDPVAALEAVAAGRRGDAPPAGRLKEFH